MTRENKARRALREAVKLVPDKVWCRWAERWISGVDLSSWSAWQAEFGSLGYPMSVEAFSAKGKAIAEVCQYYLERD